MKYVVLYSLLLGTVISTEAQFEVHTSETHHLVTITDEIHRDPNQSNEARVRHFLTELNDSFFRPVSLELIAKRIGMSKRTLTSLFRKETGSSVLNYVQGLRIDHAKRLLKDSQRPVVTIAFECGFDNLSNFYRTFKKFTNQSPIDWRRRSKPTETISQSQAPEIG